MMQVKGQFRIHINELKDTPYQDNLVLDTFFSDWASSQFSSSDTVRCAVGTGSTAPDPTNISLEAQIAYKDGSTLSNLQLVTSVVADEPRLTMSMRFIFSAGAAVGNISELGIHIDKNRSLHTRALIKDSAGNPTVVSVKATDILIVDYQLVFIPEVESVGTINVKSVPTTYTLRLLNLNQYWSKLLYTSVSDFGYLKGYNSKAVETTPATSVNISGWNYEKNTVTLTTSSNSKVFTFNLLSSEWVSNSIQTLYICQYTSKAMAGVMFDPPISKDDAAGMIIPFKLTLSRG